MRATSAFNPTLAILTIVAFCIGIGCVSVNLGGASAGKRATGVHAPSPQKPFTSSAREDVDGAWINEKTGNLISYLSDCQDSSDPSLDSILQGALMGLSELKIDSSESPMIQGREARRIVAVGKVDGVPSKIDILTFKRNHCIYILSYVGVQKAFDQDHGQFETFLRGFQAP